MLVFGGRGVGLVRLSWLVLGRGVYLGLLKGSSAWSLFSVLRASSDYLGKGLVRW